jgi:2-hydroxy-3-oxopropionate reductase
MGRPMALNLLKGGYELTVWARRSESMAPLVAAGAKAAGSAAEVAGAVDVVFSMVADAADVEQVALGAAGIAENPKAGLIYVDMSTIAPSAVKGIAERLAARGVIMLDAPVSGGEVGAINAGLTIMVGGDAAAFDTVRPLFGCLGKSATLIGGNGAGQVAKACNQILTGVGVMAVAEAFNFAHQSGVDVARVREALLGGFAYSRILDNHGQRMLDRNFKPGFKAWMHQKDMNIVMQEAHRLGLMLPSSAATAQTFNAMVGSGMGEEDSIAALKLLENLSGEC